MTASSKLENGTEDAEIHYMTEEVSQDQLISTEGAMGITVIPPSLVARPCHAHSRCPRDTARNLSARTNTETHRSDSPYHYPDESPVLHLQNQAGHAPVTSYTLAQCPAKGTHRPLQGPGLYQAHPPLAPREVGLPQWIPLLEPPQLPG